MVYGLHNFSIVYQNDQEYVILGLYFKTRSDHSQKSIVFILLMLKVNCLVKIFSDLFLQI